MMNAVAIFCFTEVDVCLRVCGLSEGSYTPFLRKNIPGCDICAAKLPALLPLQQLSPIKSNQIQRASLEMSIMTDSTFYQYVTADGVSIQPTALTDDGVGSEAVLIPDIQTSTSSVSITSSVGVETGSPNIKHLPMFSSEESDEIEVKVLMVSSSICTTLEEDGVGRRDHRHQDGCDGCADEGSVIESTDVCNKECQVERTTQLQYCQDRRIHGKNYKQTQQRSRRYQRPRDTLLDGPWGDDASCSKHSDTSSKNAVSPKNTNTTNDTYEHEEMKSNKQSTTCPNENVRSDNLNSKPGENRHSKTNSLGSPTNTTPRISRVSAMKYPPLSPVNKADGTVPFGELCPNSPRERRRHRRKSVEDIDNILRNRVIGVERSE